MAISEWWHWELTFTFHCERRMEERGLSESDVRRMLQGARRVRRGRVQGRFEAAGRNRGTRWVLVLEPDLELQRLFVITVFPAEG